MAIESALRSTLGKEQTQRNSTTQAEHVGADAARRLSRLNPTAPTFVSDSMRGASSLQPTGGRFMNVSSDIYLAPTLAFEGQERMTTPQGLNLNMGKAEAYSNPPEEKTTPKGTKRCFGRKVISRPFSKTEQRHERDVYHSDLTTPVQRHSEQPQLDHSINSKRKNRNSDANEEKAYNERRVSRQAEGSRKSFRPASTQDSTEPPESTNRVVIPGTSLERTSTDTGAAEQLLVPEDSKVSEPKPDVSMNNQDAKDTAPKLENPRNRPSQITGRIDVNSTASSSDLSSALSLDDPSHNIPANEDQTAPESDSAVADSDASSSTTDSGPYVSPGPSFHSPSTSNYTEHSNDNGDDDPDTSSIHSSHKAPARTASERSRHSSKSTRDRTNLPVEDEGRVRRRITAPHNANLEHLGQNRPAFHQQTVAETMYILMDAGTKLRHALVDVQQYLSTADGAIPSYEDPLLNDIKSSVATLRIRTKDVEEASQRLERLLNHVARPRESNVLSLRSDESDTTTDESDVRPNRKRIGKARKRQTRSLRESKNVGQQQVPVETRQAPTSGSPARTTRNSAETSVHTALDFTRPSRKPKGFAERADSVLDYV